MPAGLEGIGKDAWGKQGWSSRYLLVSDRMFQILRSRFGKRLLCRGKLAKSGNCRTALL